MPAEKRTRFEADRTLRARPSGHSTIDNPAQPGQRGRVGCPYSVPALDTRCDSRKSWINSAGGTTSFFGRSPWGRTFTSTPKSS